MSDFQVLHIKVGTRSVPNARSVGQSKVIIFN